MDLNISRKSTRPWFHGFHWSCALKLIPSVAFVLTTFVFDVFSMYSYGPLVQAQKVQQQQFSLLSTMLGWK